MKIFIDSADILEIKKYMSWGICDGVTTNPTIFLKAGVKGINGVNKKATEIAKLVSPMPYSVEVTSDEPKEILKQARKFAKIAKNIVVKVTIVDRNGDQLLSTVRQLVSEGIAVNVTAITTFNQAVLAAKAINSGHEANSKAKKISYISIFAGRISEEHGVERASQVIVDVRNLLDFYEMKGIEIIIGSVRSPENVESWSRAGAHILTIPPEVIAKSLQGARTKETVVQFLEDSQKAIENL